MDYTYTYVKTTTGRITVRAKSSEEAEEKAYEELELLQEGETSAEVGDLSIKDVDHPNQDDHE